MLRQAFVILAREETKKRGPAEFAGLVVCFFRIKLPEDLECRTTTAAAAEEAEAVLPALCLR